MSERKRKDPSPVKLRCAKWCGGGCTEESYQLATKLGKALAKRLGRSWKGRVWENLGWHHEAVSACGLIKVGAGHSRWVARFGVDSDCRWTAHGTSPKAAVKAVLMIARSEEYRIHTMISMVHNAALRANDHGVLIAEKA